MPEKRVNPVFVCLGQKNRRTGFPINHLQRNLALRWLILPITDFDGTVPTFTQNAKKLKIENEELTIYYDMQCPYVYQYIEMIAQYCEMNDFPVSLIQVDTLQKAKELPCVFNNFGVFYKGVFETVNLLNIDYLKRILKK